MHVQSATHRTLSNYIRYSALITELTRKLNGKDTLPLATAADQ